MKMLKARKRGEKRFAFVGYNGRLNPLRVHASRFTPEQAKAAQETLSRDNPEYEFKVVDE